MTGFQIVRNMETWEETKLKKLSDQKHASKLFHGKSEKDCHVFNKRKFISSYFNTWGVIFIYFLLITT